MNGIISSLCKGRLFYKLFWIAELFTSLELVKKLDFGDGRNRYELNDHNLAHSHHHLICLGCGKVVEFSYNFLDDLKKKVKKENAFNIVDYQLKFYGYCSACEKNNLVQRKKILAR